MKKSYVKILILEITLILIMLFNNFVMNNLTNYFLIGILIVGYLLLRLLLGKEKKQFRYSKDITLLVIIYTIMLLLLTYIFGMLTEFTKSVNYWNFEGIATFIIPTILMILITEIFRENMLRKSELSKPLIILTVFMFTLSDLILKIGVSTFITPYDTLMFFAYYFVPSVVKNILCSYLCIKVGYKSAIVYRLIMECYTFIIPIYPNFGDYINSIVRIVTPTLLLMIIVKKIKDEIRSDVELSYHKKYLTIRNAIAIVIICVCVYLTSGSFKYFTLAIGSGSMSPLIHKGDMVIVKKLSEEEKNNVKVGDILAHKKGDTVVVHRIVDIYKSSTEFLVYTKGDANEKDDNYPIDKTMMIGVVKLDMPLIGYPTIVINENIK